MENTKRLPRALIVGVGQSQLLSIRKIYSRDLFTWPDTTFHKTIIATPGFNQDKPDDKNK